MDSVAKGGPIGDNTNMIMIDTARNVIACVTPPYVLLIDNINITMEKDNFYGILQFPTKDSGRDAWSQAPGSGLSQLYVASPICRGW